MCANCRGAAARVKPVIYVVATAIKHGKGGISTALTSIIEALESQGERFRVVESHQGSASRWQSFRKAQRALAQATDGDVVWLHGARWLSLLRKYLLARGPRSRGARTILHIHGIEAIHYLQHPIGRWLMQRLVNRYDGLVVLTPWWRSQLLSKLSYPAERIHIMPNTLDRSLLALAQSEPKPPIEANTTPIHLLCMTRLEAGKNVDAAIATLRFLPPQYHLTIAGDGGQLESLRQQARELELGHRVDFLGWVPYEDKNRLLSRMDLFLLPSELDSFGMGFLEAMAAGLPVVGVAYGPIVDVVPTEAGKLVPTPSPELLADAVQHVFAEHPQRSAFAQRYVLETYQAELAVQNFLEFCQRLR
ncbi:glycosyltransferase family 4 protein [Pseudidiomarina sp. 1APR75-33.1]|uniref:glycosyltransferase family 4 protein n=1 Tax=Pseudidiomarina terrestris TaxID=2820060 RepID=UPI00264EBF7B|nr:glycosyltransferase family 4 protein [Pseudidiomarina sp. 1APR75-33.1]MDN7126967.1 glycosyltransferase family 4 protein [Pseudidiomarina sp. 1APR75-33.1]